MSRATGRFTDTIEAIPAGMMTFKYLAKTRQDGTFVVRCYPSERESTIESEPELLRRCRHEGIPVPEVVADSRTDTLAKFAYIVYRFIEGDVLADRLPMLNISQRNNLAAELAATLYRFEQVRFKGSGELISGVAACDTSWRKFVQSIVESGLHAIRAHGLLDADRVKKLARLVRCGKDLAMPDKSTLVWSDVSFSNIIVDKLGRLAGLIDFESCLSGDLLATLGCFFATHGDDPFLTLLVNAWPDELGSNHHDRILYYSIFRCLRLARYAHLPTPTGCKRDPLNVIFPGLEPTILKLNDRFSNDAV